MYEQPTVAHVIIDKVQKLFLHHSLTDEDLIFNKGCKYQ